MRAQASQTPYCCGLMEIGAFKSSVYDSRWKPVPSSLDVKDLQSKGRPLFSVTRTSDKDAIAALKRFSFAKVVTWKNPNTKRQLTMWMWVPKESKQWIEITPKESSSPKSQQSLIGKLRGKMTRRSRT